MSFRMCSLVSGSEGNAVLVEADSLRILIDCGISYGMLEKSLSLLDTSPGELDALLLTHEHQDHVKGLSMLLKKHNLPVYTSRGSFEGLSEQAFFSRIPKENFHLFRPGESFWLKDIMISPLPVSHDAREPVAFRGDGDTIHFAAVTDLGYYDETLIRQLKGLEYLLLEANHDPSLLEVGPYPYPLKLRIAGDKGHLSNQAAGKLLKEVAGETLKEVLLGHLSKTNNYPPLALRTVENILGDSGGSMPALWLAPARELSHIMRK